MAIMKHVHRKTFSVLYKSTSGTFQDLSGPFRTFQDLTCSAEYNSAWTTERFTVEGRTHHCGLVGWTHFKKLTPKSLYNIYSVYTVREGTWGSVVVKALRY